MIGVNFNKERAEYLLDCLKHGKPIRPEQNAWTGFDMLALAGACYFCAMSQGPAMYRNAAFDKLPQERREAVEQTFLNDLFAAIAFYSELTMVVADNRYDEQFEPDVMAVVATEDTGGVQRTAKIAKGVKKS